MYMCMYTLLTVRPPEFPTFYKTKTSYCAGHNYTTETQIETIFFCGTVPKTGFLGKKKIIFTVLKQKPSKKSKIRGSNAKKKIPQKKSSYRYDRHNTRIFKI